MESQSEFQTPRERYRESLRRTILDAAREAFVRDGYDGVSMRKLAERIGCSHGNLYVHFKDKEALFEALVAQSFDRFGAELRKRSGATQGGDPVEILRKAGRAYVEFGVANPSIYEFAFMLRRPALGKPHVTYERMVALVRRCVKEKRFRRVDVKVASQSLWAAAHGITSLLILRPTFDWADRQKLIGQVIDAAVDSLLA